MRLYVGAVVVCGLLGLAAAQQPGTSGNVQQILEQEGSQDPVQAFRCSEDYVQKAEQKILNQIRLKQFVDARGGASLEARSIAACAIHPEIWHGAGSTGAKAIPQPSPATLEQHVGRALAFQYLAGSAGGMVTPEDEQAKANALTLFKAAGDGEGGSLAKRLTAAEDQATAQAAQVSTATLTARAAVTAYQDNQAAFNAKYEGKRIVIDGTIANITAGGDAALIVLHGIVNKNPDRQRLIDDLHCNVKDQGSVVALHKNMRVRASGIYDQAMTQAVGPITLSQCTVEPAGH